VAELIANRLTEKFQQAVAADENGYAILSSQQSASGKPLILLLRDQEWLVQEIAWDAARGSDDPQAPWPTTPTPLDFFSCYALTGPLKDRIEKRERVASLNDLRVVSTRRVAGGVGLEFELKFKSLVDLVRIQRSTEPDIPTIVASVSNTVLTSLNVHSLYRTLSSSP